MWAIAIFLVMIFMIPAIGVLTISSFSDSIIKGIRWYNDKVSIFDNKKYRYSLAGVLLVFWYIFIV